MVDHLDIVRAQKAALEPLFNVLSEDQKKAANDTLGHLAGDRILRTVGKLIRKNIREVDLGARYGGEEFALILPNTHREGTFPVVERIRRMICEHRFPPEDSLPNKRLTVSMGVGVYPTEAITVDGLIRSADRLLYRAKHEGKNRVCYDRA